MWACHTFSVSMSEPTSTPHVSEYHHPTARPVRRKPSSDTADDEGSRGSWGSRGSCGARKRSGDVVDAPAKRALRSLAPGEGLAAVLDCSQVVRRLACASDDN